MSNVVGILLKRKYGTSAELEQQAFCKAYFKHLLSAAEAKNSSSTGIMLVRKKSDYISKQNHTDNLEVFIYKEPKVASEFVKTEGFKTIINKINTEALAVIGQTNSEVDTNLHNLGPFFVGDILGAHAGNVLNYEEIIKTEKFNMKGSSDGEMVLSLIEQELKKIHTLQKNTKSTSALFTSLSMPIKRCADKLKGNFVSIFFNQKKPYSMYILRGQKKLDIKVKQRNIIFASGNHIIDAANRTYFSNNYYTGMAPFKLPKQKCIIFDLETRPLEKDETWVLDMKTFGLRGESN